VIKRGDRLVVHVFKHKLRAMHTHRDVSGLNLFSLPVSQSKH